MGMMFHLSCDSDIDLNEFSEIDVERDFKEGNSTIAMEIGGPQGIDSIQRWLGHAMTEYEYNEWMWCIRYLKGAIHTGKRLIIAIHKTTGFASLMLQDALGVLEVFAFDHIESGTASRVAMRGRIPSRTLRTSTSDSLETNHGR